MIDDPPTSSYSVSNLSILLATHNYCSVGGGIKRVSGSPRGDRLLRAVLSLLYKLAGRHNNGRSMYSPYTERVMFDWRPPTPLPQATGYTA